MRVLLVTPYYAPAYAFGGPVRVTETIARALLDAGHDVTVATTDALDARARVPVDAPATPEGAEVVRFRNVSHAVAARAMGWSPRGFRAWVRENVAGFDLVHLNDLYSVLSVASARAAARAGVPYVVQPHGSTAPSRERGRPLVKRAFLSAWGRRTLAEASALLAGTAAEHADLVEAGAPEARIERIPPPLDLPHVHDRAPFPVDPTVVFLGRFDPIKRLDVLIEAVAVARQSLPRLRLVLIGGEDVRLARDAALADVPVDFPGFLDGEAKVRALQAAHVFCLLSRSEGLPVAALEALACGTPVVLSRACNLPEVNGVAGLEVDGDAVSAAAAITVVLGRRAELSERAGPFVAEYRAERVLPRLLALYERLAKTAGPTPTAP